jgi:uncharacterized protein
MMKKTNLIIMLLLTLITLTSCSSTGSSTNYAATGTNTTSISDPSLWKKSSNATWQTLQHTPLPALQTAQVNSQDPIAKGWLDLAIISKQYSTNTPELVQALQNWRRNYPSHPGNELIPNDGTLNQLTTTTPPQHIALLLPLHGPMASSGEVVKNGFLSAYYDHKAQNAQQKISFYDTNETADIGALYQKAASEGADMIIGPLTKPEVESLQRLNHFDVKVLALNYTSTSFFRSPPNNFYQFGLSPTDETQQMANKARQAGHINALIIADNNAWGQRVTDAAKSQWQGQGGKVIDTLYFTPQTNLTQSIASLLHINPKVDQHLAKQGNTRSTLAEQRRQDFDVIFIFAQPDTARQIIPLLRFYYAGNIPVYSISAIYSGRPNPIKDRDLNGVTFCETPWIIQMAHSNAATPNQYNRLYAVGRDAYLLSQAMPRLNTLPNFPIYGATGALDMEQQQVHQRLPWVTMRDGQI